MFKDSRLLLSSVLHSILASLFMWYVSCCELGKGVSNGNWLWGYRAELEGCLYDGNGGIASWETQNILVREFPMGLYVKWLVSWLCIACDWLIVLVNPSVLLFGFISTPQLFTVHFIFFGNGLWCCWMKGIFGGRWQGTRSTTLFLEKLGVWDWLAGAVACCSMQVSQSGLENGRSSEPLWYIWGEWLCIFVVFQFGTCSDIYVRTVCWYLLVCWWRNVTCRKHGWRETVWAFFYFYFGLVWFISAHHLIWNEMEKVLSCFLLMT